MVLLFVKKECVDNPIWLPFFWDLEMNQIE